MKSLLWLLLANAGIFWLEYAYRTAKYGNFFQALPYIILPILMGQVGLYYGFRYATSLFVAGTIFTLINVGLRIVNSYRIGENLNAWNWGGVAMLVVALILLKK